MGKILISLLIFLYSIDIRSENLQYCNLTLEINGFKNDKGWARIAIFDNKNKKAFPSEYKKAIVKKVTRIKDKKVIIQIDSLKYGIYAVSVHHDEDANNEINTNWIGLPKEGLGASNDAKGNFGPPGFDDAAINLNQPKIKIFINIYNP